MAFDLYILMMHRWLSVGQEDLESCIDFLNIHSFIKSKKPLKFNHMMLFAIFVYWLHTVHSHHTLP